MRHRAHPLPHQGTPSRAGLLRFEGGNSRIDEIGRDRFRQTGIRCNAICPGTTKFPFLRERIHSFPDPVAARAAFIARPADGATRQARRNRRAMRLSRFRRERFRDWFIPSHRRWCYGLAPNVRDDLGRRTFSVTRNSESSGVGDDEAAVRPWVNDAANDLRDSGQRLAGRYSPRYNGSRAFSSRRISRRGCAPRELIVDGGGFRRMPIGSEHLKIISSSLLSLSTPHFRLLSLHPWRNALA